MHISTLSVRRQVNNCKYTSNFGLVPSPIWVAKTQVWPDQVMQSWFLKCLASCTPPEGHPGTSLYGTHWQGTAEFITFFIHAVVLGWLSYQELAFGGWLNIALRYLLSFLYCLCLNVRGLGMSWPEPKLHVYDHHVCQQSATWALDQTITKTKSRAWRMQL